MNVPGKLVVCEGNCGNAEPIDCAKFGDKWLCYDCWHAAREQRKEGQAVMETRRDQLIENLKRNLELAPAASGGLEGRVELRFRHTANSPELTTTAMCRVWSKGDGLSYWCWVALHGHEEKPNVDSFKFSLTVDGPTEDEALATAGKVLLRACTTVAQTIASDKG